MKKLLALTTVVGALVVAALAASPAPAATCRAYSATAHDQATSPAGPFVGVQDVTLGGMSYSNVPAITDVLTPLVPEGDSGVFTTTTSHTIVLPFATITTIDKVHLIPTATAGVYRLVSHLVLTGNATGQIELQGTVNFGTLSAEGTFVGTVCA